MRCEECGRENGFLTKFCSRCGTQVPSRFEGNKCPLCMGSASGFSVPVLKATAWIAYRVELDDSLASEVFATRLAEELYVGGEHLADWIDLAIRDVCRRGFRNPWGPPGREEWGPGRFYSVVGRWLVLDALDFSSERMGIEGKRGGMVNSARRLRLDEFTSRTTIAWASVDESGESGTIDDQSEVPDTLCDAAVVPRWLWDYLTGQLYNCGDEELKEFLAREFPRFLEGILNAARGSGVDWSAC